MLTLVTPTPPAETPIPTSPLFDMDDLMEMAEADIYLRMPVDIENLHRNLQGRTLHARCLVKLAYYASRLLNKWDDYHVAAQNEEAMLKHGHPSTEQRKNCFTTAMIMRHQARKMHLEATAIFLAIGQAEILSCAP